VEIPSGSNTSRHAFHRTMKGGDAVTILCEIQ
jgi:hypothetical protein